MRDLGCYGINYVMFFIQANVPYSEWFDIEAIQSFHKAILLEDFLDQLAPQYWPEGNRTGYCYR